MLQFVQEKCKRQACILLRTETKLGVKEINGNENEKVEQKVELQQLY